MADVKKGVVTQVTDGGAVIRPSGGQTLTPALKPAEGLSVGDSVAFVLFEDGAGIILGKM
jgi:hypothetical protein